MLAPRRRLIQRSEAPSESPAPSVSSSRAAPAPRTATALPPYEPISCPLTDEAKIALHTIPSEQDYSKYRKHLDISIKYVTNVAMEGNDRLHMRKQRVEKLLSRERARQDAGDEIERSDADNTLILKTAQLQSEIDNITTQSEESLRALIDYKVELDDQQENYTDIVDALSVAPAPIKPPRSNQQNEEDDEDEEQEIASSANAAEILSPLELLLNSRSSWRAARDAKSMRDRYAEDNEYKNFKRVIHDARHPGDVVPHSSTWFPNEGPSSTAGNRRRTGGGEDDDDFVITGQVESLKCPLTLQTFKEPVANKVCKHVFEKNAILEYHRNTIATVIDEYMNRRGRRPTQREAPKTIQCPATGCDKKLARDDFYPDELMVRKVKRAEAAAAAERDEEEYDDGHQAEELSDGEAEMTEEDARRYAQRIKTERLSQVQRRRFEDMEE